MAAFIRDERVPNKMNIVSWLPNEPTLATRTWKLVKDKTKNLITKKKKIAKNILLENNM